jgi:hypothetical protein
VCCVNEGWRGERDGLRAGDQRERWRAEGAGVEGREPVSGGGKTRERQHVEWWGSSLTSRRRIEREAGR